MKITALIGVPGVGKSSIMRKYLGWGRWTFLLDPFAHHVSSKQKTVVLGNYNTKHKFPGTDRLSMGVQPRAVHYIDQVADAESGYSIIWEGDRLSNGKMFDHCLERGYDLAVVCIYCSGSVLDRRQRAERAEQSSTFQAGRYTKVMNLVERYGPQLTMLQNDNETQQDFILDWITERHRCDR